MQPLITPENVEKLVEDILVDIHSWRKEMIHYIKDENPELNKHFLQPLQKFAF